ILIRIFRRQLLCPSLNAYLSLQFGPKQQKTNFLLLCHRLSLFTMIIRKKAKAPRFYIFYKNHPRRRETVVADSSQHHRIWFEDFSMTRFVKPALKLLYRIA